MCTIKFFSFLESVNQGDALPHNMTENEENIDSNIQRNVSTLSSENLKPVEINQSNATSGHMTI